MIARRAENFTKLRVSDAVYDRMIEIKSRGASPLTLIIGSGRSDAVHLRVKDADEVFQIKGLSIWSDLNTTATRLIDTSYFDVKEPHTVKISGPGERMLEVKRGDDQWTIEGISAADLDQDKAKRFVDAAKTLVLTEVASDKNRRSVHTLKAINRCHCHIR